MSAAGAPAGATRSTPRRPVLRRPAARLALAALLLLVDATVLLVAVRRDPSPATSALTLAGTWVPFALAVLVVRRLRGPGLLALLLGGQLLLSAAGLSAPPGSSNDAYRYAWDARVLTSGTSPYDDAPVDARLDRLREPWLFPPAATCASGWQTTSTHETHAGVDPPALCSVLNRPTVHTIYPPVAELWFAAVHLARPAHSLLPYQVAGALVALAVTGLLLLLLRARRAPPGRAALWAWSPLVPLEAVNNAHVDTLAALLVLLAVALAGWRGSASDRPRAVGSGVVLGLAVLVKLWPVVVAAALTRRRAVRLGVALVLTVAVAYLPFVLVSSGSVLGFLTGYLGENGFGGETGGRYLVLRVLVPDDRVRTLVAVAAGAVLVAVVLARSGPARVRAALGRRLPIARTPLDRPLPPDLAALVLVGGLMLLANPNFPWYVLVPAALAALLGRGEWLVLGPASQLLYLAGGGRLPVPGPMTGQAGFTAAAVVVVVTAVLRARRPADQAERTAAPNPQVVPEPADDGTDRPAPADRPRRTP